MTEYLHHPGSVSTISRGSKSRKPWRSCWSSGRAGTSVRQENPPRGCLEVFVQNLRTKLHLWIAFPKDTIWAGFVLLEQNPRDRLVHSRGTLFSSQLYRCQLRARVSGQGLRPLSRGQAGACAGHRAWGWPGFLPARSLITKPLLRELTQPSLVTSGELTQPCEKGFNPSPHFLPSATPLCCVPNSNLSDRRDKLCPDQSRCQPSPTRRTQRERFLCHFSVRRE